MSDEIKKEPPREAYEKEYYYQQAMSQHNNDFDDLLASVPEDQGEIRQVMREMFCIKPDKLLDPEKLQTMKDENPTQFEQVSSYYIGHLKKILGLD